MALTGVDAPELESITIRIPGSSTQFDHFLSYEYNEHFLTPCAHFQFDLDEDELSDYQKTVLVPGAGVTVTIQDHQQCQGFIDAIHYRSSRSGGTVWHVECRDWLSPAVDAHVDPQQIFSPSDTLQQFLQSVLGPFDIDIFSFDNTTNRNVITGRDYGTQTNSKGQLSKRALQHQVKPYPNEGAFAFALRVAQRFGLHLWPGNDGQTVIVGTPDFEQAPRYQLRHRESGALTGENNILESVAAQSRLDQPSVIVGYGTGGGGDFAKTTLRALIVNPIINADITPILDAYPTATPITVPAIAAATPTISGSFTDPNARPLFKYDGESHTLEELSHFLLRELGTLMRKSLTAHYTFMGHRLNGQVVAVDSIVSVDDDRSNLHMNLWVISRTFTKRPGDHGTRTTIELIRPGTLIF